jgi:hypothetical protein
MCFPVFQRIKKKLGNKIENVCKLNCQSDFKTSVWEKIDSSLTVYILFEDSRLKVAMNRLQFILRFSIL